MNKNILWIVIGVVAALAVIYLVTTTDLSNVSPNGGSEENANQVGKALVPGTSVVSEDGKVLAADGKTAQNNAEWGTTGAPQQSNPVDVKSLPNDSVNINVSAGNFAPNSFKVKAGKVVVLSLTSKDAYTHLFNFADQSLKALAIGVGPGETRAITFNAPNQKGQYQFFDSTPGHKERGETGVMIVE
mgnify:CR=1 FL=1